jgi:hypothetical protein
VPRTGWRLGDRFDVVGDRWIVDELASAFVLVDLLGDRLGVADDTVSVRLARGVAGGQLVLGGRDQDPASGGRLELGRIFSTLGSAPLVMLRTSAVKPSTATVPSARSMMRSSCRPRFERGVDAVGDAASVR